MAKEFRHTNSSSKKNTPLCSQIAQCNPELAHEMFTDTSNRTMRKQARKICSQCPLRVECLVNSFQQPSTCNTIIAGLNYLERLEIRKHISAHFSTSISSIHKLDRITVLQFIRQNMWIFDNVQKNIRDFYRVAHQQSLQRQIEQEIWEYKHLQQGVLF